MEFDTVQVPGEVPVLADPARIGENPGVTPAGTTVDPPVESPLRVAVIGAGPAGIYAAEALAGQDTVPVAVDLIDRLPTPFGLVRYGIAPDHTKMRGLRTTLQRTLEHPRVRFIGT